MIFLQSWIAERIDLENPETAKHSLKKLKKVVDKENDLCYSNKAVANNDRKEK